MAFIKEDGIMSLFIEEEVDKSLVDKSLVVVTVLREHKAFLGHLVESGGTDD